MRNGQRKKAIDPLFTISLLVASAVLPNWDRLLWKDDLTMAKAIAADGKPNAAGEAVMPLARDPDIAVEEEYQIARQGTVQSLELFIARHPEHPPGPESAC